MKETQQTVQLTTTEPNFGGIRYWLVCPNCGRRAGKLYVTDEMLQMSPEVRRYECRLCLGLVYLLQYKKGWRWRFFHRHGLV